MTILLGEIQIGLLLILLMLPIVCKLALTFISIVDQIFIDILDVGLTVLVVLDTPIQRASTSAINTIVIALVSIRLFLSFIILWSGDKTLSFRS